MLKVYKSLFSVNYTAEELEKFNISIVIIDNKEAYTKEDRQGGYASGSISVITLSTLLDYVLVKAQGG